MDPELIQSGIADYPLDFEWSYFQVAPMDQRLSALSGDEWILLEGLHPSHGLVRTRLPSARALASLYSRRPGAAPTVAELKLDTLHIEPDENRLSLLWRGSFPVMSELAAGELIIAGGLELPGKPIMWPQSIDELEALASPQVDATELAGGRDDDLQRTGEPIMSAPGHAVPAAPPSAAHGIPEAPPSDSYAVPAAVPSAPHAVPEAVPSAPYSVPAAVPSAPYAVPAAAPSAPHAAPAAPPSVPYAVPAPPITPGSPAAPRKRRPPPPRRASKPAMVAVPAVAAESLDSTHQIVDVTHEIETEEMVDPKASWETTAEMDEAEQEAADRDERTAGENQP